MKRFPLLLVAVLLTAVAVLPAVGQDYQDPNTIPPYFLHQLMTGKAYANSQIDTLPQPASDGTSTGSKLGGASMVSLRVVQYDSAAADIYIDYQLRGSSTWTQAYADSAKSTGATTITEIIIRKPGTDRIGGVDRKIRARIAHRATGAGTTSPTEDGQWVWKP